jgi:two-component system copper resistance phosphate regulon response regulator CusR
MSTILIAEDEERIALFVDKGLRAAGFTTIVASTGPDALAAAQGGGFDLVLLDIGLPGMDGFEVLRRLRATDAGVPVIMLTARSGLDDTVAGLEGGANDYIPKPFRFDELLARVRRRRSTATGSNSICALAGRPWATASSTCPLGSSRSRKNFSGMPTRC